MATALGLPRENHDELPPRSSGELSSVPTLPVVEDPGVGLIDHLREEQQVVTTETVGGLPMVAILVKPRDTDVEAGSTFALILPDGGFDGFETDLMYGLNGLLFRHGELLVRVMGQRRCYPAEQRGSIQTATCADSTTFDVADWPTSVPGKR